METGANPPGVLMFNAVGGSTHHWAGHFPRFHPSDFRIRSEDGVGVDWPIAYDELRPHYQLEGLTVSLRLVSKLPSAKGGA